MMARQHVHYLQSTRDGGPANAQSHTAYSHKKAKVKASAAHVKVKGICTSTAAPYRPPIYHHPPPSLNAPETTISGLEANENIR
jgi:hypothetical protein